MISVLIYCISVFTILLTFYFYKRQQEHDENEQQKILNEHYYNDRNQYSLNTDDLTSNHTISSATNIDYVSLSSNISLSDNLEQINHNNNNNDLINTNEQNYVNSNMINFMNNNKFNCYTYSNYKNYKLNQFNYKNDIIIIEFFKRYINRQAFFKYLGLKSKNDITNTTTSNNTATNNLNQTPNAFQIYDSYK